MKPTRCPLVCILAPFAAAWLAACATVDVDEGDVYVLPTDQELDFGAKPPESPRDAEAPTERVDASPMMDPCGDLDLIGVCAGDTLRWCDRGVPQAVDCAAQGMHCAFSGALARHACVPPAQMEAPPAEGCPVAPEGECDPNGVLYGCFGDAVQIENCRVTGRACGWDAAEMRFACLASPPAEDACGGVTPDGRCVADRVEICRAGRLATEDCVARGGHCELVEGRALCLTPAPVDPCADIAPLGQCEGDTVVFCADGERGEFACSDLGWVCFGIPGIGALCSDPNAGGDPPLEGEGTACTVNGVGGVCQRVSRCAGTATPGHCPGPNEVLCCTGAAG